MRTTTVFIQRRDVEEHTIIQREVSKAVICPPRYDATITRLVLALLNRDLVTGPAESPYVEHSELMTLALCNLCWQRSER